MGQVFAIAAALAAAVAVLYAVMTVVGLWRMGHRRHGPVVALGGLLVLASLASAGVIWWAAMSGTGRLLWVPVLPPLVACVVPLLDPSVLWGSAAPADRFGRTVTVLGFVAVFAAPGVLFAVARTLL